MRLQLNFQNKIMNSDFTSFIIESTALNKAIHQLGVLDNIVSIRVMHSYLATRWIIYWWLNTWQVHNYTMIINTSYTVC